MIFIIWWNVLSGAARGHGEAALRAEDHQLVAEHQRGIALGNGFQGDCTMGEGGDLAGFGIHFHDIGIGGGPW